MKRIRAGLSALVVILVIAGGITVPPAGAAPNLERRLPEVPVILIHGLGGSAEAWDGRKGVLAALKRAGYELGRTLFLLDYKAENNGDYTVVARDYLRSAIDSAMAASGASKVDLVAFSMGGLVARYYVNSELFRRDVRTLVLIASPGRGSFAANLIRTLDETNKPNSLISAGETGVESTEVNARKFTVLHQKDAANDFVNINFWRDRSLFEWLIQDHPDWYREQFVNRQYPPSSGRYAGLEPFTPGDDEDLTGAYNQTLALTVAESWRKNQSQARTADGSKTVMAEVTGSQTDAALTSPQVASVFEGSWPSVTERDAAPVLSFSGAGSLISSLARRSALAIAGAANIHPSGKAIRRLLADYIDFPIGRSSNGSVKYDPLKANYFLDNWNLREAAVRRQREEAEVFAGANLPNPNVKYVVIAGAIPNVWEPFFPNVGDNDSVVEVASAFLPLGENDRFQFYWGLDTHHLNMKNKSEVAELVVKELRDFYRPKVRWAPAGLKRWWRSYENSQTGKLQASAWEPTYIEVSSDHLKDSSGRLTVELEAGATETTKGEIRAWAYLEPTASEGIERRELVFTEKAGSFGRKVRRAQLKIDGFGRSYSRVRIGTRLTSPDLRQSGTRAIYRSRRLPVTYNLLLEAVDEPSKANQTAVSGLDRPWNKWMFPDFKIGQTAAATGNSHETGESPRSPIPPPIAVKRSTKQTTHYKEDRTYHQRWVWDFGDGAIEESADPKEIISRRQRVFSPGRHRVTATSFSNKGEVLRKKTWDFEVKPVSAESEPGVTGDTTSGRDFTAETIREPGVRFKLDAPKHWITGRPADIRLDVEVDRPANATAIDVDVDPGREFQVVWERPGRYTIKVAAIVRVTYEFPEGKIRIRNVYTHSVEVEVLAIGMTD